MLWMSHTLFQWSQAAAHGCTIYGSQHAAIQWQYWELDHPGLNIFPPEFMMRDPGCTYFYNRIMNIDEHPMWGTPHWGLGLFSLSQWTIASRPLTLYFSLDILTMANNFNNLVNPYVNVDWVSWECNPGIIQVISRTRLLFKYFMKAHEISGYF